MHLRWLHTTTSAPFAMKDTLMKKTQLKNVWQKKYFSKLRETLQLEVKKRIDPILVSLGDKIYRKIWS